MDVYKRESVPRPYTNGETSHTRLYNHQSLILVYKLSTLLYLQLTDHPHPQIYLSSLPLLLQLDNHVCSSFSFLTRQVLTYISM